MSTNPETPVADLLIILAPPVRLAAWLETVFEQKRARGEDVPENFVKWLDRWSCIRSDLPSAIDGATDADWADLERKVFAR